MDQKKLRGRAWVFGDNVDTDLIYHNKYLAETDPKKMPQFAFEYYPGKEKFAKEVKPGDFVVAGRNFGCGSSREHAVYCLKEGGVPVVLAESFARIYYRNAINNGYPVLFVKGLSQGIKDGKINDGDELEIDAATGLIRDLTNGAEITCPPLPKSMAVILDKGGLVGYVKERLA